MRVLLLSAYDTDSHKSWCQGLIKHLPDIDWTYLSLPGRYFSWRIRGNALSWAYGKDRASLEQSYDLIIATSMVDLATLRGLIPSLANIPAIMYFHENQFAYPKSADQHASIEPQMVNLYSALSAETLLFNSQYNLNSFTTNARKLLNQLPDHAPASAIDSIHAKSQVIPVPIELASNTIKPQRHNEKQDQADHLKVIWNHRWEYDKGPDLLLEIIKQVEHEALSIQFIVAGLSFRNKPEALKTILDSHFTCVAHIGTFDKKEDYYQALNDSQVVLSTAIHEFQGLAVLEGAAYGCIPLTPNRLAYPEWVPSNCMYPPHESLQQEAGLAVSQLKDWLANGLPTPTMVENYSWQRLANVYLNTLNSAIKK